MRIPKIFQTALLLFVAVALISCGGFFTNRSDSGGGTGSNVLYVANFNGGGTGTLSLFNVNNTSAGLSAVGNDASTGNSTLANGPTSLAIVASKFLYSANDGGGV